MGGGVTDTLTIRQAAALLGVHPNTVRNRIKSGMYEAEKVVTERGETYLINRPQLEQAEATNATNKPIPSASHSQPLPIVREAVQEVLEPFVRELGNVREELGRERERRERAERRVEELERQLEAPREPEGTVPLNSPEREKPDEQEEPTRPFWRRWFRG